MKKFAVGICVFAAVTLLFGCGKEEEATVAETPTIQVITVDENQQNESSNEENDFDESLDELEAIGSVDVERNLFSVEVTVPKDFVDENTTQESLNAELKEGFKSATLNPDGTVTYVMTKEAHEKTMEEMAASIEQSCNDMIGSTEYPNFKEISHNNDFTEFTVKMDATDLGLTEAISVMGFYMYGGLYNIYNGTPVDNVNVKFVNSSTGDIISECNSKDAGK